MYGMFLFFLTNFLIMGTIYFITSFFDVGNQLGFGGINYTNLAILALIYGMAGSFISVALSKWLIKRRMGIYIVEVNNPQNDFQAWLVDRVQRISQAAGIKTPEIGLYEGGPNAFATGMFKNSALVAFSSGLIESMSETEIEAVIGHEIGHIANGDMTTMAFLQGLMNAFVFFFARVVASVIQTSLKSEALGHFAYAMMVFALEITMGFLGSIVLMWFSRRREYRADAFSANILGKEPMINALIRLSNNSITPLPNRMAAMGISGGGFAEIFSTHPSLQKRVDKLNEL